MYSASPTQTGARLDVIRRRLLRTLGYFATGVVTSEASSLEAERYVISESIQSDQSPPEHFDGMYVYVNGTGTPVGSSAAASQRRVMNGTFDGAYGAIMNDRGYDAPLAVGRTFEVSVLPAVAYLGVSGANDIINEALESLTVLDYLPITVVEGQTQYSLAGYNWPIKSIDAVVYSRTNTTGYPREEMPKCWTFDQDAEAPVLSFWSLPDTVGNTIELRVHRPANTRIKTNGAWADSSTGLSYDDDECLYDAATVVAKARPIAYERLALRYPEGSPERTALDGRAEQADIKAATQRWYASFRGDGRQKAGAGRLASNVWWQNR